MDIAKILKDKPQGIRLYSPIFGECAFCYIREDTDDICVKKHNGEKAYFNSYGLYCTLGEVMLFPSREMRDWSKFSWKKCDVLVSNYSGTKIIFDKWYDDSYTSFNAKHYLDSEYETEIVYHGESLCATERYSLADKDAAQTYISAIEKRLGGKLNRETLEIEKAQTEFKDGDIAFADYGNRQDVFIVSGKTGLSEGYNSFISLGLRGLTLSMGYRTSFFKENLCELRLATEEEKKQLFDALAKEGKAWDSEKKQIVDLPKKCEFKVFEKVLVRESKTDEWTPNFFFKIHRDDERYVMVCGDMYNYCIPYNEETAHLLGTTDEWKGGEQ